MAKRVLDQFDLEAEREGLQFKREQFYFLKWW